MPEQLEEFLDEQRVRTNALLAELADTLRVSASLATPR